LPAGTSAIRRRRTIIIAINKNIKRYLTACRPGGLEDTQQSGASQNADAEGRHDAGVGEDLLDYTEYDDERVEPVEHGHEVALEADAIHLDHHLDREQANEEQIRYLCHRTSQQRFSLLYNFQKLIGN